MGSHWEKTESCSLQPVLGCQVEKAAVGERAKIFQRSHLIIIKFLKIIFWEYLLAKAQLVWMSQKEPVAGSRDPCVENGSGEGK